MTSRMWNVRGGEKANMLADVSALIMMHVRCYFNLYDDTLVGWMLDGGQKLTGNSTQIYNKKNIWWIRICETNHELFAKYLNRDLLNNFSNKKKDRTWRKIHGKVDDDSSS